MAFVCFKRARGNGKYVFSIDDPKFCTSIHIRDQVHIVAIDPRIKKVHYKQSYSRKSFTSLTMSLGNCYSAGYNDKKPWMSNFDDDWLDIAMGEVRKEVRGSKIDLNEYLPKHLRIDKNVQCLNAMQKECSPLIVSDIECISDIQFLKEECPICFSEFNSASMYGIVKLPKCGHVICARCVSALLKRLPKSQYLLCCLCRQSQDVTGKKK